jgi:hypothetical protein
MKKLGPWIIHERYDTGDGDPPEIRFADPHDGRVWDLDQSPKWVVLLSGCCTGERRHYTWVLSDGVMRSRSGSEKTREEAREKAHEALRRGGWENV